MIARHWQGYNHAKFERPPLKVFVKSENTSFISLEYVQNVTNSAILIMYLLNSPPKFQLNWMRKQNIQLKLFDTAVTSKCGQGH